MNKDYEYKLEIFKHKGESAEKILSDLSNIINRHSDLAIEREKTKRLELEWEARQNVEIIKTLEQAKTIRHIFTKIFDERKAGIKKAFDVIDAGIENHNIDELSRGLASVTEIVKTDPFRSFANLSFDDQCKAIDDGLLCIED